MALSFCYLDS